MFTPWTQVNRKPTASKNYIKMGNSQSSRADAKIKAPKVEHLLSESARGRKSPTGADHTTHRDLTNVEVQLVSTTEESDTDSMEYESEDEESDEGML